jgi:ribosomal protein S6
MQDEVRDDRAAVYEIGYLLAGIPQERIQAEVDSIHAIVSGGGGSIIAEEMPRSEPLAYTIRKKTVAGSYEKHDQAYFGWIKFEANSGKVEDMKKAVEVLPSVLRMLLTSTVRENTYLGKHAAAAVASEFAPRRVFETHTATAPTLVPAEKEAPIAPPATVEEMDKSIDAMVKEA